MQRTNIYLEERQCRALDRRAERDGISRAELVRRLIDTGLERTGGDDLEADLAAIRATAGRWNDRHPEELPSRGDDRNDYLETLWHRA